MNREELLVAAIENGTVIDHIPTSKVFEVVNLLHLSEVKTSIMVGWNLKSHKMGRKSIIKIADKYFSDSELNQLSVVAPNVSLCVIKDYQVVVIHIQSRLRQGKYIIEYGLIQKTVI